MLTDVSGREWRPPWAPVGTVARTGSRTGPWTHPRTGGGRGTSSDSRRLLLLYNTKRSIIAMFTAHITNSNN